MFSAVENLKDLDIQSPKQKRRRLKENKFKKFLTLFNVYAGLHLADMTREYEIMMNLNVFAGELKHKYDISLNIYSFTYIDC